MKTVVVYLTDKNKCKMFKNYVSELYIDSAKKELKTTQIYAKIIDEKKQTAANKIHLDF